MVQPSIWTQSSAAESQEEKAPYMECLLVVVIISRRCLICLDERPILVAPELMERAADEVLVVTVGWGEEVGSDWGVTSGIGLRTRGDSVAGETTLETFGETLEWWNTS